MTPLMEQYNEIKNEHRDCLLLFRMGDFYEFFNNDAVIASQLLGITLTSRNSKKEKATQLAGFPYHSLDRYIPTLVDSGHKIAICEQLESPSKGKSIVKRGVVEIITRGTNMDENSLECKKNNYIGAIHCSLLFSECGLAYLDLTTGKFILTHGSLSQILAEVVLLEIGEMLLSTDNPYYSEIEKLSKMEKQTLTNMSSLDFEQTASVDCLKRHLKVFSLESFGLKKDSLAIGCAGAILSYVQHMKKNPLSHLVKIQWRELDDYMRLDQSSVRNLEIIDSLNHEESSQTLYTLLDQTLTPMGGRLLRDWLVHPLQDIHEIKRRQQCVTFLLENNQIADEIKNALTNVSDIERLVSKIGSQRVHSRDLLNLGKSLIQVSKIIDQVHKIQMDFFSYLKEDILSLESWGKNICDRFVESPPLSIKGGGFLNPDYYLEIVQVLKEAEDGKQWFNNLEHILKKETKIPRLKVSFNRVFGYYIEVSNQYSSLIPDYFIPKQSLVNATRYMTIEMKEWEVKVLEAKEKISLVEYRLFCELRDELSLEIPHLLQLSDFISKVDIFQSLMKYASSIHCCLPQVNNSDEIKMKNARHPVVEALLEEGQYIENDVILNCSQRQILLMTGPNMAGKSTYLRKIALIILMSQIGSYVPAESACIGIVDAIFTRVGASDRLAQGKSTFMVEMLETAAILNNATTKSLILLDEVGRGTSTFDGLSLAQAIVEELHNNSRIASKTLFATHYHELTHLSQVLPRVVNLQILIKEIDQRLVFLRKVVEGKCDSSYGIQVAVMAGIPKTVTSRAQELLVGLENNSELLFPQKSETSINIREKNINVKQESLFFMDEMLTLEDKENLKVLEDFKKINLNEITPLQLMQEIQNMKSKLN